MENNKKEALKQFIKELIENKYTKDRIKDIVNLDSLSEEEEEEVCIEPFAFIEPNEAIEPLFDFTTLGEALQDADGDMKIDEKEIEFNPFVEFTEEELEYYKNLTEDLKPVDGLSIPCCVGGEERALYDGINCNIKPVPLLNINLVTPVNLKVLQVVLTSEMQSEEEIEIEFAITSGENMILLKNTLGVLADAGVIAVVDVDEFELSLSPVGFRGITKLVDVDELL